MQPFRNPRSGDIHVTDKIYNVLFLRTGNSARSILAKPS